MGVDLRRIGHAAGTDAERIHRPVQIRLPLGTTQRQPLAKCGLVDLDGADAGGFQVTDFIAQGQRDLAAGIGARLVVTHERPLQHRHRAGQHALHRLVGERLRVLRPTHRHRRGTADVAVDHRWLHAARAVTLHPAIAGEGEAIELLAEVLDHVVAFEFAVHQHVQADLLLHAHAVLGLRGEERIVVVGSEFAGLVSRTCFAHFLRLRERADGGGGEGGKTQCLGLQQLALRMRRDADAIDSRKRGQTALHRGVVHARRTAT
ncbi:hypothetical protein D3C81_875650 [compost metagenome]